MVLSKDLKESWHWQELSCFCLKIPGISVMIPEDAFLFITREAAMIPGVLLIYTKGGSGEGWIPLDTGVGCETATVTTLLPNCWLHLCD